jgi:hypothetical protein
MAITWFSFSGLFAPLQQFTHWLAGASARQPRQCARIVPAAVVRSPLPPRRPRRPLRVVRVVDAGRAPAGAGRMVISGRMADVCAELERLAALEARQAC